MIQQPAWIEASAHTVTRYLAGEEAYAVQPGDFILTHARGFVPSLVRFGQGLRKWGSRRKYAYWNHAALVVSEAGRIVEALGDHGVVLSDISKYRNQEYYIVHIDASDTNRREAAYFAMSQVGQKYGWSTIAGIALSLLFGAQVNFGFDGQFICSGLVARALERTTAIFPREPSHILPADLAEYYRVEPQPR